MDDQSLKYDGPYIQEGIVTIKNTLGVIREFITENESEGIYGSIVFDSIPEEYKNLLNKWKQSKSDDFENLKVLFKSI